MGYGVGKAARRQREARLEALKSMASLPKQTAESTDFKLYLIAIAVGIVYGLTDKTPLPYLSIQSGILG
jgi:hypothetical protein